MSATTRDARGAIDEEHTRLRSIGDFAADGEGLEDDDGQRLLDFGGTLNLSVKGSKPNGSEIKIRSISLPIHGQIERGDTGALLLTWRCQEVAFKSKYDGDGRELANRRHHTVTPVSVVPLSEEQANKVLGLQ